MKSAAAVLLLASAACAKPVPVPDLSDVQWTSEKIDNGLVWKWANNVPIFGNNHNVCLLEVSRAQRKVELLYVTGKLQKTSQLAEKADALAAINGGYHSYGKETESITLFRVNGKDIVTETANLADWDLTDESAQAVLGITEKGAMEIYYFDDPAWKKLPSFLQSGPMLVYDGQITPLEDKTWNKVVNPRTAACTKKDGSQLLITVDGRTDPTPGMTVYEFQSYVKALGCDRAINMDGGASTTMWINGKGVVNQPRAKKQPAGGEIKEHGVTNAIAVF